MASVHHTNEVFKEVPIRDDWIGQHLILSHDERVRIIGMSTTYAKLVDRAQRGFGIDRCIELTLLNNTVSDTAGKTAIDGATPSGRTSKQDPVKEPERDPTTGLPKGWILTGANLQNNQATKACDFSSRHRYNPLPHDAWMNAQKRGGCSQSNKATKVPDMSSWCGKDSLQQNGSTWDSSTRLQGYLMKCGFLTSGGTRGPVTGQHLTASNGNGMLTVKYTPAEGSNQTRNSMIHPNKGKGLMEDKPAGEPSKAQNTTRYPALMSNSDPESASRPESLTNHASTTMIGDIGKQGPQSAPASSPQARDYKLIHSFLVVTTYMKGDSKTLSKAVRDLFVNEFRRCRSLEPDNSVDDCKRDCEILETLLGHIPGCQKRRYLELDFVCTCGVAQDSDCDYDANRARDFGDTVRIKHDLCMAGEEYPDGKFSVKPMDRIVWDFHSHTCVHLPIKNHRCACRLFRTLLGHRRFCPMRQCVKLRRECRCARLMEQDRHIRGGYGAYKWGYDSDEDDDNQDMMSDHDSYGGHECERRVYEVNDSQGMIRGATKTLLDTTARWLCHNDFTEEEFRGARAVFHELQCNDGCHCVLLRDTYEHDLSCSVVENGWKMCDCKKNPASRCTSDDDDESIGSETSTQADQSGAGDGSENGEKLTPTTNEGDWNSTLTGDCRNVRATWARGSQPATSEDSFFLPARLRDVMEKPEEEVEASAQNSKGKEPAAEETANKDSANKKSINERETHLDEMCSKWDAPGLSLEKKVELAGEELDSLNKCKKPKKPVVKKPRDAPVKENPSSSSQTSEGKQASGKKESNASSSSWVPVTSQKDMKKSVERSGASSFNTHYKATVENCPEMPSASKATSGGDLDFGSSSSSFYE
ncbi:hypothetical protein QBC36DRAFT_376700 [Triangularia setosa]|uniref:Uncharacterized protein n=1 Tax=Triangularia setosa TaxID=2587417 RepID=A0AAN6WB52_9PEZI|nr:hypothetical protein QBC36DRAFT_376700 [Podospora setosa]